MKFVLMMFTDPSASAALSDEELKEILGKHERLRDELLSTGELVNGAGMVDPGETTRRVLERDRPVTVEVPRTKALPHVSSYYVVNCDSHGRAVEIADEILDSHVEAVEVREIHDSTGM